MHCKASSDMSATILMKQNVHGLHLPSPRLVQSMSTQRSMTLLAVQICLLLFRLCSSMQLLNELLASDLNSGSCRSYAALSSVIELQLQLLHLQRCSCYSSV